MKNYISINNQRIELTEEQVKQIIEAHSQSVASIRLSDVAVGNTIRLGEHEFIVLEHSGDTTAIIRKDVLPGMVKFGRTNNYDGSNVDALCNEFSEEIAAIVEGDNLVLHTVDLTSDDGLKDYGKVKRRASLLTADLYRRYVEILDKHKHNGWWWLATAHSTAAHDNASWVKCVSPSGCIGYDDYYFDYGVRPFYIFKSSIFESSEE